jgi:hypothetical protein
MQHSAVDLENYARLYTEDRLRDAERRRQANEAVTGISLLGRTVARVQSWFAPAPQERVAQRSAALPPVQLVPMVNKPQASHADPYAGMIVLVRGPKEPCSLDAA